jgi:multimeric flavodoxin WrbA
MNVVAVNGSPRTKGNTAVLCQGFLDGAAEAGATGHLLQLGEMQIAPCNACKVCKDRKPCVLADDMKRFYDLAPEADMLLLASPVYLDHVSAQMMTFIQRFYCYLGMGLENYWPREGVRHAAAITYGAGNPSAYDSVLDWMEGRMRGYWKIPTVEKFRIARCLHDRPITPDHPEVQRARAAGRKLAQGAS